MSQWHEAVIDGVRYGARWIYGNGRNIVMKKVHFVSTQKVGGRYYTACGLDAVIVTERGSGRPRYPIEAHPFCKRCAEIKRRAIP